MRRRRVASALVAFLCRAHFAGGGDLAWAQAAEPVFWGLLSGLGFHDAGVRARYVE